jgi:hypothetical protein
MSVSFTLRLPLFLAKYDTFHFAIEADKIKLKAKLRGLSPQANYTYRLSDRRLSEKLVPTLADRQNNTQQIAVLKISTLK